MTDLRIEIESLIHEGLLPDREYVSAKRLLITMPLQANSGMVWH